LSRHLEVDKYLIVGVPDDVAGGHLVGVQGCGEAARRFCHFRGFVCIAAASANGTKVNGINDKDVAM
jgi:hypothetical protein